MSVKRGSDVRWSLMEEPVGPGRRTVCLAKLDRCRMKRRRSSHSRSRMRYERKFDKYWAMWGRE